MLGRSRAELIVVFLLGVAFFAIFEAILSFQASQCTSEQRQYSEYRTDNSAQKGHYAISEPFACSVAGLPAAARAFFNANEGFVVGGFTGLLVFVTGWLVYATGKLWRGADETAQRQLCAYISVMTGEGWRQGATRGLRFEFRPVIVNVGQTPAYNVNIMTGIKFMTYVDAETFDYEANLPQNTSSVLTLGKDQNRFTSIILDRGLSKAELRDYRRGTHFILIFGKVLYRDTFHRTRHTNFSYAIGFWGKRGPAIWRTTIRHNDSD